MSNRSLLEFNHDYTPTTWQLKDWAEALVRYLSSGDAKYLPAGAKLIGTRHHSEPDFQLASPAGEPVVSRGADAEVPKSAPET